jgi:hypothetical protein
MNAFTSVACGIYITQVYTVEDVNGSVDLFQVFTYRLFAPNVLFH